MGGAKPQPTRVLIVDDDPLLASSVAQHLRLSGWDATHLCDGDAALAYLAAVEVDAVIVDLHMPGTDGLEILRATQRRRPAPVVIVLTGDVSARAAVDVTRAGADDVLAKPTSAHVLQERIEALLAARGSSSSPDA